MALDIHSTPAPTDALLGQRIDGHRVVREIGRGGMGAVYEAMHEQLGRQAALKVLLPAFSRDKDMVSRFFNEARAVNIVKHPGIVSTYGLGQLADGTVYIVMEYLSGETLAARLLRRPRCPQPEALRLCRQIASALAAAHKKGVIHRDLKPENVMIVADPDVKGGERTKVLDFGLSKVLAETQDPSQLRTRTGMVMGTPRYMAPEQCRGVGGVGDRADVYSLGVLLYQMLSGRCPFEAEGVGDLIVMQINQPPRPLRDLAPQVAPQVAALAHHLLRKQPGERPAMAEVAQELERLEALVMQPEPVAATRMDQALPVSPSMYVGLSEGPALETDHDEVAQDLGGRLDRVPRHRGPLLVVLLLAVLGIAVAARRVPPSEWQALARLVRPPPTPAPPQENHDGEAALLLLGADADLRERHFEDMLAKAERVLAMGGVSQRTLDLAMARKQQALRERGAREDADRFGASVGRKDFDEAMRAYQRLPADSPARMHLKEAYEKAFPHFAAAHLLRAQGARAGGRCKEAREQIDLVLAIEARYSAALRARTQACGGEEDEDEEVPVPVALPRLSGVALSAEGATWPAPSPPAFTPPPAPVTVVAVTVAPVPVPTPVAVTAAPTLPPPPRPAPGVAPPARLSDEESYRVLRQAQSFLSGGNPRKAIEEARPLTRLSSSRRPAWLVIGTAACKLRDLTSVKEAYRELDYDNSQSLLRLCESNGVVLSGGQFLLAN